MSQTHVSFEPPPFIERPLWPIPRLNLLLFAATIFSTMMVGDFNTSSSIPHSTWEMFDVWQGWPYAAAVLFILTCHEMGHFFAARYHGMDVSWPFYIPVPIWGLFHFGTMGAFIKIRSRMPHRNALMDVAVAGPLAGFVAALIVLWIGYAQIDGLQEVIQTVEKVHPWSGSAGGLTLGGSLLFDLFNNYAGAGLVPMNEIYHFPLLFAGWVGFFVTAMNLFLIGQLDGGHVIYAIMGRRSLAVSLLSYSGLVGLSIYLYLQHGSNGLIWVLWMVLLLVIGLGHPPTLNDNRPLSRGRLILGLLCILIFFLCFIPLPVFLA